MKWCVSYILRKKQLALQIIKNWRKNTEDGHLMLMNYPLDSFGMVYKNKSANLFYLTIAICNISFISSNRFCVAIWGTIFLGARVRFPATSHTSKVITPKCFRFFYLVWILGPALVFLISKKKMFSCFSQKALCVFAIVVRCLNEWK